MNNSLVHRKLMLWARSCFAVSFLFLFLNNAGVRLSWSYFQSQGLYSWAVLFLCILWIYAKRGAQIEMIRAESKRMFSSPFFIFLGFIFLGVSFLLPRDMELSGIVFSMLLAYIGLFSVFFGRAAMMPGTLLSIYGFSIGFPVAVAKYLDPQYSLATTWMVVTPLKALGYPLVDQGQVVNFLSAGGREMSIFINAACSGSASMTIFISIFALMMLDIRLPGKGALYMLIFGVLGTTLQNVLRIIVLILAGYYYDFRGISTAHLYAGYILFPTWFLIFVYVYMRYARRISHR